MKIFNNNEITSDMELTSTQFPTEELAQEGGDKTARNYTKRGFPYSCIGVVYSEFKSDDKDEAGNDFKMIHRGFKAVLREEVEK